MPKRIRLTLLIGIITAGAVLRFSGAQFGLPHDHARPDEERITDAALGVFQGDLDPHFFLYPSLFIYLTAAGYSLLFGMERVVGTIDTVPHFVAAATADPAVLHLVARGLAGAAGVATIAALYAVGRELFSTRAALASAAFLAVAFLHVRDSHFGVTDVPVTLLTVCAFWAAARCLTRGASLSRGSATGLLCGLAASTKYNAALIAVPALVAIADDTLRSHRSHLAAGRSVVVLVACLAAGFLVGTPFALLDRPAFLADLSTQRRIGLGLQHGSILDPARQVYGAPGWIHHATFSLRYGLGLPLLIAALAGAGWLAIKRPRLAVLVLSFPVAFYAAMGVSQLAYARWIVPIVPFLCLTAGVLVDRVSEAVERVFGDARVAAVCAIVLVAGVAAPTAATSIAFDRLVARTDTRVLGAQWIQQQFPGGTTLYQTGTFYGHLQPRPAAPYTQYAFDEGHRGFVRDGQPGGALPELVVVLDSPLVVFNHVPTELGSLLDAHYVLAAIFQGIATAAAGEAVYDQQDAFYVPFANLTTVKRPGPNVRIFKRRHD